MKVKILLIFCALALMLVPVTTAMETSIVIHTIPGYKAMIRFLHPDYQYSRVLESFHYTANMNGDIIFNYDSSLDTFDMDIWLTYEGEKMGNKRFDESFNAGFDIEIEFYPSWYTPPIKESQETETNETLNETQNNETLIQTNESETTEQTSLEQESEKTSTPIEQVKSEKERVTAFSIEDGKVSISAKGFLYIFGLFILGILIFLGIKHSHHVEKKIKEITGNEKNNKKEIKIKKVSELNKKKSSKLKDQEEKIEKAKKMIEEAQEEIQKMKNPNQSKIDEIKKRLIEDEKELLRLRKEAGEIN